LLELHKRNPAKQQTVHFMLNQKGNELAVSLINEPFTNSFQATIRNNGKIMKNVFWIATVYGETKFCTNI
jgi:hypothetical protein